MIRINCPQSLTYYPSLRPLCADHRPIADLVDGAVQVACPNCGFCMTTSVGTYLDLMEDEAIERGILNASLDILKGPK